VTKHKELLPAIILAWNAGKSSREIGLMVGVSRNVIVGMIHRARLAGHDVKLKAASGKNFHKIKAEKKVKLKPKTPKVAVSPAVKLIPFHFVPKTSVPGLIEIQDLGSRQCKYPMKISKEGKHLFCGEEQQDKSPYCPKHHKACYHKETRVTPIRVSSHKVRIYGR